jgi:hypothetical protein
MARIQAPVHVAPDQSNESTPRFLHAALLASRCPADRQGQLWAARRHLPAVPGQLRQLLCRKRRQRGLRESEAKVDTPTPGGEVPRGHQTITRVMPLSAEDDAMSGRPVKLPDNLRHAVARAFHQILRAYSSRKGRLLGLPHFFRSHEHGSIGPDTAEKLSRRSVKLLCKGVLSSPQSCAKCSRPYVGRSSSASGLRTWTRARMSP